MRRPNCERLVRLLRETDKQDLIAPVTRGCQSVSMQLSEPHRLRLARPMARASIEALLAAIGSQLDEVEAEMARHVEQHQTHMPKLLQSVLGMSEFATAILIAEFPDSGG
jgi:transposase